MYWEMTESSVTLNGRFDLLYLLEMPYDQFDDQNRSPHPKTLIREIYHEQNLNRVD